MSAEVLVAGIGNVFLGDDGFGVEVARRLATEAAPEGVRVVDFGIRAVHLSYELLDPPSLLVVVDAVRRGDPPGTLTVVEPSREELDRPSEGVADAHAMSLVSVLRSLRSLGGEPPPTRIVGCEPAFTDERLGLSEPVERAVPLALEIVRREIARGLRVPTGAGREGSP